MKSLKFQFLALGFLLLLSCHDLGVQPDPPAAIVPSISIDDIFLQEGETQSFEVTLSEPTTVDVSFTCTFLDGLATGGADFSGVNGVRTISAGLRSLEIDVTAFADASTEASENFSIRLSNGVGGVFSDSIGTATILGTNEPILQVSDLTIAEGQSASIQVTTSIISNVDITFNWTTQSGSAIAGADYVGAAGTGTILANTSSAGIVVQVNTDAITEGEESFRIQISNAMNAVIGDEFGTVTIPANVVPVSFANQVRPLLTGSCAITGCHGGGSSDGGLALGSATYTQVRNGTGFSGAIISNPPVGANSILYRVLTSSPPSGINRMPDGGPFFDAAQQQIIKDWIDQGALDN
jgi:hypothetical protein